MESSTPPRKVTATTIAEAFRQTVERKPDDVAIRTKGDAFTITWGQLRQRVDALAAGVAGLGVEKGGSGAPLFGNPPQVHPSAPPVMMVGGTPFSIYNTYAPNQIEFVVKDAGARILMTEQAYLPQVLEARKDLPDLEHVIVIDGDVPEGCLSLAEVEGSGGDFDVEASIAEIKGDDILTLIYTSGTTGPPKGVQLMHSNLLSACEGIDQLIEF